MKCKVHLIMMNIVRGHFHFTHRIAYTVVYNAEILSEINWKRRQTINLCWNNTAFNCSINDLQIDNMTRRTFSVGVGVCVGVKMDIFRNLLCVIDQKYRRYGVEGHWPNLSAQNENENWIIAVFAFPTNRSAFLFVDHTNMLAPTPKTPIKKLKTFW